MRSLRTRLALAAVAALLAAAPGCLFEPRTPAPPSTGKDVPYLAQTSSANVWANLGTSLKATHAPGWEDNISLDEFIYVADDAANRAFPGVFKDGNGNSIWGRDQEVAFINNLFNSGVTIEATMRNPEFVVPPDSGNEVIWTSVIYDVAVTSTLDQSTVRYRGSAIITFRLSGNFWYVYKWEDQVGENDPDTGQALSTLGVLRGNFASK